MFKWHKSALALVLVAAFTVGGGTAAFGAEIHQGQLAQMAGDMIGASGQMWTGGQWFRDVPKGSPNFNAISQLNTEGIMPGAPNTNYGVNQQTNWTSVKNMLRRLCGTMGADFDALIALCAELGYDLDAEGYPDESDVQAILDAVAEEMGFSGKDMAERYALFCSLRDGLADEIGYSMVKSDNGEFYYMNLFGMAPGWTTKCTTDPNYKWDGTEDEDTFGYIISGNGTFWLYIYDEDGNLVYKGEVTASGLKTAALNQPKARSYGGRSSSANEYYAPH